MVQLIPIWTYRNQTSNLLNLLLLLSDPPDFERTTPRALYRLSLLTYPMLTIIVYQFGFSSPALFHPHLTRQNPILIYSPEVLISSYHSLGLHNFKQRSQSDHRQTHMCTNVHGETLTTRSADPRVLFFHILLQHLSHVHLQNTAS